MLHRRREPLGPMAEVLQPETRLRRVADALAVVGDHEAQLVPGGDREDHLGGTGGFPSCSIGQGFPEDGEHLLGQ